MKQLTTIIRKSCLTGMAVWVYRGPSGEAGLKAYERACRRELQHVKDFGERNARRLANIARILAECMHGAADLTPRQREAVRRLQAEDGGVLCSSDFYDHIVEKRRRRDEDRRYRQEARSRENAQNRDYDK